MQLTVSSTQRSSEHKIAVYIVGVIAAVLGTITYSVAIYLNERRKVKQTFQMRVKIK
jgi:predicted RNA-binding protein